MNRILAIPRSQRPLAARLETAPRLREGLGWAAAAVGAVAVGAATVGHAKYVAAVAGMGVLAWFVLRRPGNGFLLALALALAAPYWVTLGAEQLPVERLVLVLAAGGLVAGAWRTRLSFVDAAVLVVIAMHIFTWSANKSAAVPQGLLIASVIPLVVYLVTRLSVSWETLERVMWVALVFAVLGSLTVFYEYFVAGHVVFNDAGAGVQSQFDAGSGKIFRPGGVFGGAPAASIVLSVTLLCTLPLVSRHVGLKRLLAAGMLLVVLFAVVLTFSRAGWTGLLAGTLVFLFLLPWKVQRWAALVAVIGVAATVVLWAGPPAATQSTTFREGVVRSQTVSARQSFWSLVPGLATDSGSHLAFGRGFDVFFGTGLVDHHLAENNLLLDEGGPHNDYLRALVEEGLVGLIAYLVWLLGAAWIGMRRVHKLRPRSADRTVLAGFTGAVVCYAVASLTHDTSHNVPSLMIVGIMSGILVTLAKSPGSQSDQRLQEAG
jgi:O-antigen ligase